MFTFIKLELTVAGSLDDYSVAIVETMRTNIADAAGVEPAAVSISLEAASVKVTATIETTNVASPTVVASNLRAAMGTAEAASEILGADIEVEAAPVIESFSTTSMPPPSLTPIGGISAGTESAISAEDLDDGEIAGVAIGALAGFALCIFACGFFLRGQLGKSVKLGKKVPVEMRAPGGNAPTSTTQHATSSTDLLAGNAVGVEIPVQKEEKV